MKQNIEDNKQIQYDKSAKELPTLAIGQTVCIQPVRHLPKEKFTEEIKNIYVPPRKYHWMI